MYPYVAGLPVRLHLADMTCSIVKIGAIHRAVLHVLGLDVSGVRFPCNELILFWAVHDDIAADLLPYFGVDFPLLLPDSPEDVDNFFEAGTGFVVIFQGVNHANEPRPFWRFV